MSWGLSQAKRLAVSIKSDSVNKWPSLMFASEIGGAGKQQTERGP